MCSMGEWHNSITRPLGRLVIRLELFDDGRCPVTPAYLRRFWSWAQVSGKYKRYAMGRLACSVAIDRLTATRQFSCFPNCPQYWCVTPTECVPFLGKPVSSTIQAITGPLRFMAGRTEWHTCSSKASSLHGASATK